MLPFCRAALRKGAGMLKRLIRALFAPRCCVCSGRISEEYIYKEYKNVCICKNCFEALDRTPADSLFPGTRHLDFLTAPFYYTGEYRRIFLQFKFSGFFAYGHIIGQAACEYFSAHKVLAEYDCIVPVPLTRARLNRRGFDQAALLAEHFAEGIGIPVQRALERTEEGEIQSRLSGAARAENIRDSFAVCSDVKGMRIIIADDVFTTGSTMNECARVLREAGAEDVCGAAAAVVLRKPRSEADIF